MLDNEYAHTVQALFAAAQRGDQQALDQFLTHLRPQIFATCYRLLARIADAEDAAQESLLAILAGMRAAEPLPAWQPLIFGNAVEASLFALAEQEENQSNAKPPGAAPAGTTRRQVEPLLTGQFSLPQLDTLEYFAARAISTRDSLALVFVNLLQLLPPINRAVYVLTDILGCTLEVVAQVARLSREQVAEHLAFARRVIDAARAKLPTATMLPSHPRAAKILHHLGRSLIAQNAMRAVSVFDLDAVLVMPTLGTFNGHEAIAAQFARMFMVGLAPQKVTITTINGQPALVSFQKREEGRVMRYYANLVMVASISAQPGHANQIVRMEVITDSEMVEKIGTAVKQQRTRSTGPA